MKLKFLLSFSLLVTISGILFSQEPGTIKWIFQAGDNIELTPAIGHDGTIYFGSCDGKVYAISPDGSEKWSYFIGSCLQISPLICDNQIYIKSNNGIYALDLDGNLLWKNSDYLNSSPMVIGKNNNIYYMEDAGKLYALDQTGKLLWESNFPYSYDDFYPLFLQVGGDGTIYILSPLKRIFAYDPAGNMKWQKDLESYMKLGAIIDENSNIYYIGENNNLYALNSFGDVKWFFSFDESSWGTPVLGVDGVLYITTRSKIYKIDNEGTEKWHLDLNDIRSESPLIGNDGTIFVYHDGKITAIDENKEMEWFIDIDLGNSSPAISPFDSTLYVGSYSGKLYAIKTNCSGLANSAWPKYLKNIENSNSNYNQHCPVALVENDSIVLNKQNEALLDASLSYDPDGDQLNYTWICLDKPLGSEVAFSNPGEMKTNVIFSQTGKYIIGVTITDDNDGFSSEIISVYYGIQQPIVIASDITYSAALDTSDAIYFIQNNNTLTALNSDHSLKWSSEFDEDFSGPPVISQNGSIYVMTNTRLCTFSTEGALEWTYPASYDSYFGQLKTATIGNDGTIYCKTSDGVFSAINADGTLKWNLDIYISSDVVIGQDGTIYVGIVHTGGGYDPSIIALNPDGTEKWSQSASGGQYFSVKALDSDGTLYITTMTEIIGRDAKTDNDFFYDEYRLIALYQNGVVKWSSEFLRFYPSYERNRIVSIGADGQIYLPTFYKLYGFDRNGNKILEKPGRFASPLISDNGSVYLNSENESLLVLNANGSEKISYEIDVNTHLNMNSSGMLIFGGTDNKLYALQTECSGLSQSEWPKYRKDKSNNGNSQNPSYPKIVLEESYIDKKIDEQTTLDASRSYDPDRGTLAYAWQCVEKPYGSQFVFTNSSQAQTGVVCQYPGPYTFELSVTSNNDNQVVQAVKLNYDYQIIPLLNSNSIQRRYIQSAPAIDEENNVYVGTGNDIVYIINLDGQKIGCANVGNPVKSAVVIGKNNSFYTGTVSFSSIPWGYTDGYYSHLCAKNIESYDSDWSFALEEDINSSTAIGPDGTLYFGCDDHHFYALNIDGSLQWSFKTSGAIESSPAINEEGIIYVGSFDSTLYAINPYGTELWAYKTDGRILSSPAIGHQGIIYFGSDDGSLYALNPDGSLKWSYATGNPVRFSSPVIHSNGTIYMGVNFDIYAINPDGTLNWKTAIDSRIAISALLGDDGSLYFGAGNKIYALNSDGSIRWTIKTDDSIQSPPAINRDGMLYLGSKLGCLYTVKTQSSGLMDSPWPKFRSNYANTGSLAKTTISEIDVDFHSNKNFSVVPFSMKFYDDSRGIILNREWYFGDGNTSTAKYPEHTYIASGLHTVTLTASNTTISRTKTKDNYILCLPQYPPLFNRFIFSEDFESTLSDLWQFNNSDHWQIQENNNSIYINTSNYSAGANDKLGEHAIINQNINEDFTFQFRAKSLEDLTVNTAADYCGIFGYVDDDNYHYFIFNAAFMQTALYEVKDSERTLIQNRYGNWIQDTTWHNIKMTCQDSAVWIYYDSTAVLYVENINTNGKVGIGSYNDAAMFDDIQILVEEDVVPPPVACFIADTTEGIKPFTVTFTDSSTGEITSWHWDFGDGMTSTEQNPTHIYETADTFNVTLIIAGPWGSDTLSKGSYIHVMDLSGIDPYSIQAPKEFALYQNYPNPFNPSTKICYAVKEACHVHLSVYNLKGQIIKTLIDAHQESGHYSLDFNMIELPSGIYFYRIRMNNFSDVKKMMKLE